MGQSPSTPVQHCERDLELARGQGNKQLEAKAHLDLGNAYKSINQFQKAIPHFKEGLKLAKIRKDKELEKQAYRQLVDVHKSINDVSAAFEYFEKAEALQFRKEEQDIIEKLSTRDSTIFGAHDNSKNNHQTSNSSDGDKTVDNEEQIDPNAQASAYRDFGNFLTGTFMYKGAIEFYKKAREVFPDLEGDELEVVAYEWLGDNHLQIGQYKESIECYNEIVKLASQLGNKKREINAYFGLGSAFSNTGDFESSEKYFLKALTMTGQDNDKSLQREVHIKLGHVYYESGKFDTALKSYLRAQEISLDLGTRKDKGNPYLTLVQEISPDLGKKKDEANIYFMLGNTFQQLKEEEKAIESYQRAIDISKELKDEEMQVIAEQRLGTSCLNLALVCSENGEHEASVKWYKKALDIFGTELNDHVLRRKALTGLAVAWFNLGYTEKAIKSIQEAKNISEKEYNTDGHDVKIAQEQKNCTDQKPSSSQVPAEWLKSAEETCNPTSTKKLPKEGLLCLEKYIEEFSASNVYTISASSKEPLTEKVRKSMTANVKSSAYKNLLSPNEDRHSGNDGKFVNDDQQIFNFATDDLSKNTATTIPARLFETLSKNMKSIGQISCGQIQGTCWLVADMLVITNCHVYMSFNQERRDHPNLNLPITVKFDYLHPGQGEQVEVDEERDPQLESFPFDYKVLRLKEDEGLRGREPLGPIVRSRTLQEGLVIIVGHPAGKEMHEETCVVVRSHSWRQKLQDRQDFKHSQMNSTRVHMTNNDLLRNSQSRKFQEQGCLPYDTSLFSGASGSPVFNLNGNIVAMHTQGYTLDIGEEKWSLMEFGVQFNAICKDMRQRYIEHNVVKKLFPDCDLEDMDIDN